MGRLSGWRIEFGIAEKQIHGVRGGGFEPGTSRLQVHEATPLSHIAPKFRTAFISGFIITSLDVL